MKCGIIIYVENKNLVIKQINSLFKNKTSNISFIILLDSYEYLHFFSNYGTVIMCGEEKFISKKIQLAYNYIKDHKSEYSYIFELNSNFIIKPEYIKSCIDVLDTGSYDIVGSKNFISYNPQTKDLCLESCKLSETQTNLFCRCFTRNFLESIGYKIFDFQKNDNIYELSNTYCILQSAKIFFLINSSIYKIVTSPNQSSNFYISKIYSEQIFGKIEEIISDYTNVFFNNKGIKQVYVSKDLEFFKPKIKKIYNLVDIKNKTEPALFFGMYSVGDLSELTLHQGIKYIIWGGSDADTRLPNAKIILQKIKELKGVNHFAISQSIYSRLEALEIKSTLINFSLVDQGIFNPSAINYTLPQPKKIFVYNGRKTSNPIIYNQKLVDLIINKLSTKYEFILSSNINVPNELMATQIYSQCFMGIRLCENDGNANTVQEMGMLGLPVLHNGVLPNSVAWSWDETKPNESIRLIEEKIDYIYKNFWGLRHIISDSVDKCLSQDKRENICIFVPMWYRHGTTEKNIHLLSNQIYPKTKIILIYSNDQDKEFALALEKRIPNLYPIEVENRPLSKKFQFGAEFSKIFYPKGIIINGSDDFLSLNYSKCVYDSFGSGTCNYLGCNFWYVGDLASMLLYKFKYNDPKRVVGCGRAFKYDLLDKLGWQIFPLDRNSGIDGASKEMIRSFALFKALDLPKCFTFSFKEKTDMITPMSNLLKSEHNSHEIISDPSLLKIMYSTNLYELETTFKFQETSISINLYLFVTLLDEDLKRSNPVMLNSYYMEKVLGPYFDIIDIRNLDKIKLFNYKLIFIDGIALNTRTTKLDKSTLYSLLNKIKNIPKVLLAHDIHDYSFDFDNGCQPPKEMLKRELCPIQEFTIQKENIKQFLKQNNIQNIITVCDCEEFDFMYKYYSDQVKKFFILSHHIPQEIFYPRALAKKYDILIYGWSNSDIVYPFRTRLKKLLVGSSRFKVHVIERTSDIKKMPIENDLAELISQSWICVTCVSNFSYLVRKYFEIGACGSIPCGNINAQGKTIFGSNVIELDPNMSDYEIIRIIDYYLSKPELLIYMGNQIKTITSTYNYNMFIKKILEIKDDVINGLESSFDYSSTKKLYSSISPVPQIHRIINNTKLNTWVPNQKATIEQIDVKYIVTLGQSKSTPGIKQILSLEPGNYLLSFNFYSENNLTPSVFCFASGSIQTQIQVNEEYVSGIVCGYFKIQTQGSYILYVLITNPSENSSFQITNIELKQIDLVNLTNKIDYCQIPQLDIPFNKKIAFGSISCVGELTKLYATFGGTLISKDQILKKTWIKDNTITGCDYFVLLGLYSPHHWEKIYKPLFDKFKRVMIIFTGTDILQLSNDKISPELKKSICGELCNSKYILGALNSRNQTEIKKSHGLNTQIISLPVGLDILPKYGLDLDLDSNPLSSKSIGCYFGDNLEWYCHSIVVEVARKLPDYTFYFYKYGGFEETFGSKEENYSPNIIYLTKSVDNFADFLQGKFCSLRITLHDGEPMTGIETMILGKPFIFNHQMEHSIQTTNDPIHITWTIQNTWELVESGQYNKSIPSKYYLERNSNKVFEKNLIGWFGFTSKTINSCETNKILQIPTNSVCISEHYFSWSTNISPGHYLLKFIGRTNGYGELGVNSTPSLTIISNKHSKIYKFETLSWLEFKVTNDSNITFGIKLYYPQANESVEISSLSIQQV